MTVENLGVLYSISVPFGNFEGCIYNNCNIWIFRKFIVHYCKICEFWNCVDCIIVTLGNCSVYRVHYCDSWQEEVSVWDGL